MKPLSQRFIAAAIAAIAATSCSTQRLNERLDPAERAVQPTVKAFECGGESVKAAIASCRSEGGHYGHCALIASRASMNEATACYTYANDIRKRRAQLVGQEDQIDAQIRYLQDVNLNTANLNDEMKSRVEEATVRADTALDSLAQGQMTASELSQLRAILDIELSSSQRQLDAASQQLRDAGLYRSRQPAPNPELDAEIARLEALLADTQRQTSALALQRQRL